MLVKLSDLRTLSNLILTHLEQKGLKSIELTDDYYWDLPKEKLYDPYQDPCDFEMGQLSDDWSDLLKILEGKNEPIGYGLVWLSSILRAIGEQVVD